MLGKPLEAAEGCLSGTQELKTRLRILVEGKDGKELKRTAAEIAEVAASQTGESR